MRPADRRGRLATARLYLCTPLRDDLEPFLETVLAGGVDLVQIRDKAADDAAILDAAPAFRAACDAHDALLVVNDDPALAVAAAADGVHVGQDDASPAEARDVVGPDVLVGLSTHSTDQLDAGARTTADYLAIGPVDATPTKPGRRGVGLDPVRHAAATLDRPWYVTGGMAPDTAGPVLAAGAFGLVVVRALTESDRPGEVAATLTGMLDAAHG